MGFMACELMRRVLGVAKRRCLEGIGDVTAKLKAETIVLDIAEYAILGSAGDGPKIEDAAELFKQLMNVVASTV
jgi:5-methylthioribose kinase